MLTELWWGIGSYGKWGQSTERSCSGGGFAACLPGRLRQLSWAVIGSLSGVNAVNLYTQVCIFRHTSCLVLENFRTMSTSFSKDIIWLELPPCKKPRVEKEIINRFQDVKRVSVVVSQRR